MITRLFDNITGKILRHPVATLLFALLVTVLFVFLGREVRLSNHFADLFSVDNEANEFRALYRTQFGADDGLLVAVLLPAKVDEAFFHNMEQLAGELGKSEHFVRVLSPVSSSVIFSRDDEVFVDPLSGVEGSEVFTLEEKMALLRKSPGIASRLVSTHANAFAVVAEMPVSYDHFKKIEEPARWFRERVTASFVDKDNPVEIHFSGIAYTRIGILELMMQDLLMLVPLTALAIGIFMFWLFRCHLVVWVTLLTILFGVSCTIGLIGLNHDHINQLTLTFPVLLMVIVVATDIHFFHRYFSELRQGRGREEAVAITASRVGRAAFLSCFTTTIGFYSLLLSDMEILRSFGLYLGTGVMFSFIGMMVIIPPCLLLVKLPAAARSTLPFSRPNDIVSRLVAVCTHEPSRSRVMWFGLILLVAAVLVSRQANYDYYLKDMLDENHPQVAAGKVVDKNLSGALPVEISLLGQPGDFRRAEVLQKMAELGEWLEAEGFGHNNLSLATVVLSLNEAFSQQREIPSDDNAVAQLLLLAEGSPDHVVEQLVNDDYSHARIRASTPDIGAYHLMEFQNRFNRHATGLMAGTGISVRMTGELPVAYEGMNRLTQELIRSVLMAMLFIVFTILLVFRDFRLALGSIFPNILPIVLGLALYALSGKGVNPLPGIAFCIAIGIAVDDTIHLFARFNEEMAKGAAEEGGITRHEAVRRAVEEVKGALITSSVILMAGFAMFLFSGFTWNRDLGWLGAFLILVALLADLIFTPAILSYGGENKKQNRTTE
jgi:predicted RND superfamily exporter protein